MEDNNNTNNTQNSIDQNNKQIDAIVLNYLKRKGYIKTEALFKEEAQIQSLEELASNIQLETDLNISNLLFYYNVRENSPKRYEESYSAFRNWVYNSLDLYKAELMSILYPLFVHCYLDLIEKGHIEEAKRFLDAHKEEYDHRYAAEIIRLQSITTPEHLKENELACLFRNNKFNVKMCTYSFELMLGYLHEMKFMLLLSLINQYINIRVFRGHPQQAPEIEYNAISGTSEQQLSNLSQKPIYWGLLKEEQRSFQKPPIQQQFGSNAMSLAEQSNKENKTVTLSTREKEDSSSGFAPKSSIPLPKLSEEFEAELKIDTNMRAALSATSLPSICFYTFFNTYDGMNTVDISEDGSLVAAGFSDSTIKLWDLQKEASKWSKATREYYESDGRDAKYKPKSPTGARSRDEEPLAQVELVGHSGPVYTLDFSPDGQFLLSGGQDGTVRLWSMYTKTNLVAYIGHSYPVWQVKFCSLGFYFATASYDRTARLWSTNQPWPLRIFAGHLSDVNCVDFHPNCNYIVTGSTDKCLRIWEVNTGNPMRIFTGHYGPVYAVAVSPDGRFVASGGEDHNILLWDLASSQKVATLKGHTGTIWSLSFSREGTLLASGKIFLDTRTLLQSYHFSNLK
jgi:transcription initiation factor TFIID subunit 5